MASKLRMDLGLRGTDIWYETAKKLSGEPWRHTAWRADQAFLISANASGLLFYAHDFVSTACGTGETLFESARQGESKPTFEPLEQGSEEFFLMRLGETKSVDVPFVELEVDEPFDPRRLKWRNGASARTTVEMKTFHLLGNEAAILSLASQLLSLAGGSVPVGTEMAYDTGRGPFMEGSIPFVIQKRSGPR